MMRHAWVHSTLDSAISRPGGTGSIDVGTHGRKIGYIARGHALERGLSAEEALGRLTQLSARSGCE